MEQEKLIYEFEKSNSYRNYTKIKQLIEAGTIFKLSETTILADMLGYNYDSQLFRLLINNASEIKWDSLNDGTRTIIDIAIWGKNHEALELLLKASAPVSANTLRYAGQANDSALIKIIFANVSEATWNKTFKFDDVLWDAATDKRYETLKALLETKTSFKGTYLLHTAVNNFDSQAVSIIIDHAKGIDLNEKGECGNTPLVIAAQTYKFDAIKLLLQAGATVNGSGLLPYYVTGSRGIKLINIIIENAKGDVNWNEKDQHGYTALDYAYSERKTEIVDLLTELGAKPSYPGFIALLNTIQLISQHAVYTICPADSSKNPLEKLLSWTYSPSLSKEEIYTNFNELYQNDLLKGILYTNALDKEHTIALVKEFYKYVPEANIFFLGGYLQSMRLALIEYDYERKIRTENSQPIIKQIAEDIFRKLVNNPPKDMALEQSIKYQSALRNILENPDELDFIEFMGKCNFPFITEANEELDNVSYKIDAQKPQSNIDEVISILESFVKPIPEIERIKKFPKGSYIHELSHKLMCQLFGEMEPYANDEQKEKYKKAIDKTLNNMQLFGKSLIEISQQSDFGKNQCDTLPIVSKLEPSLYLKLDLYANEQEIQSYQKIADQVSDYITKNPENIIYYTRNEACYPMVYFPDQRTNAAINDFYMVYVGYSMDEEHKEFIVRYPQAVAEGFYDNNPKLQIILEPLKEYWDSVIEPKMQEYNFVHGSWAN
jgi:hypothetical protein